MSIENTNDIVINNTVINNKDGDLVKESESEIRIYNTWDELDLNPDLLRSIYGHGFEKPSPIQSKGIAPIKEGRDIIAQAQSGTGKTGCFTVGALSRVNVQENSSQVLIMAPTHELAQQIASVIHGLSNMITGIRIKTVIGGSSIDEDANEIRENPPHIIVGCPGRVFDMIRRRHINANKFKFVILD